MSGRHRLEKLLQNPRIWIAGHGGPCRRVLPTGFVELDVALSGGWPVGQLIELLIDPCGMAGLEVTSIARELDWSGLAAEPSSAGVEQAGGWFAQDCRARLAAAVEESARQRPQAAATAGV